jgi:23S rRNA (uridine2552-2'-O)-methyltransferase
MGRVRGKDWMKEHVADAYVKRAKAEGMRSRAAYKLDEIAERDRLLKPGLTVVDLGAAPGGWSQVAAERVGSRGRVIALDLLEMRGMAGVTFIQGDFYDDATVEQLEQALGGVKADLVLSDMAPNLSGIAVSDQARVLDLGELALDFAVKHLKPKGNFLVKSFQGSGFDGFLKTLRSRFESVAVRKPDASRSRSSEVYLVGKGLRA